MAKALYGPLLVSKALVLRASESLSNVPGGTAALALRPVFAGFATVLGEGEQTGNEGAKGGEVDLAAVFREDETFEVRVRMVVLGISMKLAGAAQLDL